MIEYKQPSTLATQLNIDKAKEQLLAYLESIVLEVENEAVGYITDGVKFLEMRSYPDGSSSDSGFSPLDGYYLATSRS